MLLRSSMQQKDFRLMPVSYIAACSEEYWQLQILLGSVLATCTSHDTAIQMYKLENSSAGKACNSYITSAKFV